MARWLPGNTSICAERSEAANGGDLSAFGTGRSPAKRTVFHGEYDFSDSKLQDSVGLNAPEILTVKEV